MGTRQMVVTVSVLVLISVVFLTGTRGISGPAVGKLPAKHAPATSQSADWLLGKEGPVHAPFVKPGVRLAWAHRSELIDDQARTWLRQFNIDSTLLLSVGQPYEPYLRLAIAENGTLTPVAYPSDLENRVQITSPEQALGFLRLFSGSATWYRFPNFGWLEVKPRTGAFPPEDGEMQKEEFSRLKLMAPQVIANGDGFRVLRPVARMPGSDASKICILDETVSRNGRYAVRILAEYRLKSADAVYASGLGKM